MKCRKLYKTNNNYNVVFFKSKGVKLPYRIYVSLSKENTNFNDTQLTSQELSLITFSEHSSSTEVEKTFDKIDDLKISCKINIDRDNLFNSNITNISFKKSAASVDSVYNCTISLENEASKTIDGEKNENYKKLVIYSFSFNIKANTTTYTMEYLDGTGVIPFKDFCCAIKTDDNYAYQQEGVAYGLIQRMSIIKGELWYQINHGLPLLDKVRNKQIFDSVLINIILNHPDVKNIEYFNSYIDKHIYKYSCRVLTIYNASIEIENTI